MDNLTQNNDNKSDSNLAITDVSTDDNNDANMIAESANKVLTSDNKDANMIAESANKVLTFDNNDANMIAESANSMLTSDNNDATMIAESANTPLTSDNTDANMIAESANTLLTSDNKDANTLLTPDNTDNTVITLDNTVLQQVDNNNNIQLTSDNKVDNTDNTSANTDNTDVSTLGKAYNIRLEGVFVQKVNELSDLTGIAATAYVTSLVKAQLLKAAPNIDLEKVRLDERQKCAAQQAEMMKLYIPKISHESEIRKLQADLALGIEKYDLLHKEAKRLFNQVAEKNQKINNSSPVELEVPEKDVINIGQFQEILGEITKVIAKNRFVHNHELYSLGLNLFNQTINQIHAKRS